MAAKQCEIWGLRGRITPERSLSLGAPFARFIAGARLLDLEDGGAVVGEDLGAEGTGKDTGQVEDFDPERML
jgi:hypothetical protein